MRDVHRAEPFKRDLKALSKKHKSLGESVNDLLHNCAENGPDHRAKQIPNMGGRTVFKQRLKLENKGTRAGARIIYYCDPNCVIGLALYVKGSQTNVPNKIILQALKDSGLVDNSDPGDG